METAGSFGIHDTARTQANLQPSTTVAERCLIVAAMCGAVCGAFAGSTLAAGTGIPPELLGLFGIIVGSPIAAAGWSLISAPFASRSH